MNRNLYKLVFSKRLRTWVAVSESVKSQSKSSRRRMTGLANVLLAGAGLLSFQASAGLVPDAGAPLAQRPQMDHSANNTDVVNITAPNATGLSHNKFTELDVSSKGVILNNSQVDGVSRIGGFVMHNPNLVANGSARAALLEVTGSQRSSLGGTIEGHGQQKMDVFIANPNGITANGVSSVNLNSLTLTTGRVIDATNKPVFDVSEGNINIEGRGVNTEGLQYFDLVAQAVALNGPLTSDSGATDINVIAGRNSYNAGNRTFTKQADAAGDASEYRIDGSALGSMYGANVQLVSTGAGLGVRHAGTITALKDLAISADGDIEVKNLAAGKQIRVTGRNVDVVDKGSVNARDAVLLNASNTLRVLGDVSGDTVRIRAKDLMQDLAKIIARSGNPELSNPAVDIQVDDKYTLKGKLVVVDARGNLLPNASYAVVDGRLTAIDSNGAPIVGASVTSTLLVASAGAANVSAGSMENAGGRLESQSGKQSRIVVKATLNNNGQLIAQQGSLEVKANNLDNGIAGEIVGVNGLSVDTASAFSNRGALYADKDHIITVKLPTGNAYNSGEISAGSVLLTANQLDGASGAKLQNRGLIRGGDGVEIAVDELDNAGALESKGAMSIRAATQLNNGSDGVINANGDIALSGQSVVNKSGGVINSNQGDIAISASEDLRNEGFVAARHGQLKLNSGNTLSNGSTDNSAATMFGANGVDIVAAGSVNNSNGARLQSNYDVQVKAKEIINTDASWVVGANVLLSADEDISNLKDGLIQSDADSKLALKAGGNVINDEDAVIAGGQTSIAADGDVTNQKQALVLGDSVDITAGGKVVNQARGMVYGDKSVHVQAQSLTNDGAELQAGAVDGTGQTVQLGSVTLSTVGDTVNRNAGTISATDTLTVAADNVSNKTGGRLRGDTVSLTVQHVLDNNSATIEATDKLSADATQMNNAGADAGIRSGRELDLSTRDYANTAEISSRHNATLTIKDDQDLDLTRTSQAPVAEDLLTLNARNVAVNVETQNPGSIQVNATGRVDNKQMLVSGADLSIDAHQGVKNHAGALLFAGRDLSIRDASALTNETGAEISAQRDMTLAAPVIDNAAGARIASGRDMAIDAQKLIVCGPRTTPLTEGGGVCKVW
ncbi:filamentous hemagglutinin N-terminal domain-containing protein [Burkholderia sp. JSH-S8]|nr:filamentous hemagglutinin N-terminal domain-containing protein [Burkholderia sp. JSH-S8]